MKLNKWHKIGEGEGESGEESGEKLPLDRTISNSE